MKKLNHKLKDEELFGGFEADNQDTFINSSQPSQTVDELIDKSETIEEKSIISGPVLQTNNPKTKRKVTISPPIYKPDATIKKKEKNGLVPFIFAAVFALVIFAGFAYWIFEQSTPMFYLSKSVMQLEQTLIQGETKEKKDITGDELEPVEQETEIIELKAENSNTNKTQISNSENYKAAAPNPEPAKDELIASKIIESKPTVPKQELPSVIQPKTKTTEIRGLFVIEAYSTDSYEDARIWVEKLNRRNLNASILPQKLKDKVIYKVRFGQFETKSEAEKMAMNLGLSRSYIDRIK